MAVYTIVASSKSPLGPFEVKAGQIAVNEGDRFILDPSVDISVSFVADGGRPANFEVEIAQTNAGTLDLQFGTSLAPSLAIGDDVDLANIQIDAQEAASVRLTAGDRVSLGGYKGSLTGTNTVTAGDDFLLRGDLQTGSGDDVIRVGANASLQDVHTLAGNDDLKFGANARVGDVQTGDGDDVARVGADAGISTIDGGNGNDTVLTRTTPAAASVKNVETVEVVCFAAGTRISTACGAVPIEELRPGDLVTTLDHALQPIRWIGSRHLDAGALAARPDLKPVRIKAGALGAGLPRRDLLVSPQHRVLVRSPIAQRMFGASEILIPARKLTGIEGIDVLDDATSVTYWRMLFDCHEIVFAEGATTESLLTGAQAMQALPGEAVDEILALFPQLADPAHSPVPARPIRDQGRVMQRFASRHSRNDKPLVEERV